MASTEMNHWREGRSLLEVTAGALAYASLGERWYVERLIGGKVLISGQVQCSITIYYAHPVRGGGILWWKWRWRQKGKLVQIVRK